jgi:hypothetical protein
MTFLLSVFLLCFDALVVLATKVRITVLLHTTIYALFAGDLFITRVTGRCTDNKVQFRESAETVTKRKVLWDDIKEHSPFVPGKHLALLVIDIFRVLARGHVRHVAPSSRKN